MRIGILKADSVLPSLRRFGEYTDMFPEVLKQGDPDLSFASYDVEHGQYPEAIEECDAYLITGSRHSVYDPVPWIPPLEEFVRRLEHQGTKLVGVCFGHQLVARALGGRTEPAESGWTLGVHHSVIENPFPWVEGACRSIRLIHSHRDQVTELPAGAEHVGGSDACPLGLYRIGRHVMCVQGHPEFSPEYARALYAARRETFGETLYRDAVASLDEGTDRIDFARWMVSFFRGP